MADWKKHVVKMAALGRQFQLGGLYDYINDRALKDSPGWKPIDLSELVPIVKTELKMKTIPADSDSDKWEQMGLDEHLKASTLVGLIDKYRGASNYLNDRNNPGQVSQTVVFRIKVKKEDVDLSYHDNYEADNLDAQQTKPSGKGKKSSEVPSHVIVGVVYGAEIYCVLTQELADETDEDAKEEAKNNLIDWVEQMGSALEEGQDLTEFKEQFEKEEKQQLIRMKCRLYIDIQNPNYRACGFFDAYKHCLKLIEQVKKLDAKSKVVPISYKLYPLKIFMDPVAAARNPTENREVDSELMARCCSIWTQLENIIARATALSSSTIKANRTPLLNFISYIQKYQELMKKRMKIVVLQARNASDDDDEDADKEFENVVNIVENHLNFKPSRLEKWLRYKSAEIEMTNEIINLKDVIFVATIDQLKKQLAESFDKKFSLVLQVTGLDERTNAILGIMDHIKNDTKLMPADGDDDDEGDNGDEEDDDDEMPWHMVPSKKKPVLEKMSEYSNYVARNKETENKVQFFITFNDKKKGFGCQYSIYEKDQVLKENIQLPDPPTDLRIHSETTNESAKNVKICLKWKYQDIGYPHQFVVEHRPKDSLDSWTQQNTSKPGQKQVAISFKRGSMLEFRVAANTCIGRSSFSNIVDTESASVDDVYDDDDDYQESVSSSASSDKPRKKQESRIEFEREPECSFHSETRNRQGDKTNMSSSDLFSSSMTASDQKSFTYTSTNFKSQPLSNPKHRPNYESDTSQSSINHERCAIYLKTKCKKIGNRNGMDLYEIPLQKPKDKSTNNVVQRFVFGKAGPKKGRHKTILIMGATGSGKTTLINGMINYIFGVEWEDTFRFELIREKLVGKSQANSQTSIITAYDIHHMKGFKIPYSLTIVDTPGYGDTKGLERDQEITDMVRKFFEDKNGIQELDVVGFVSQASLPRLTPTQIYIFDSVLSIFGNDVKENINFLLTFADSQKPPVLSAINAAGLPCPIDPDSGEPLHHKFNNSGFFCSSHESNAGSVGTVDKFNRFFWKMGMENFRKFFAGLALMKTKSLSLTKKVLEERKRLETTVDGLQPLIKYGLTKMEELRKTKQLITINQKQIEANEDVEIEIEVTVPKKKEIPAGRYLTNCNKCYITCHNPCAYKNDDDKVNCSAMNFSMPAATRCCTVCPEKCIWNMHANQPYSWEYVKEKQTTSSDAIKQKYEKEQKKKLTAQELIDLLERDISNNEKKVLERVEIVAQCIKRLDAIALRPNPFSTPQYIDLIIDAEEQEKKPGFKERIKSLRKLRQMAEITSKVRNKESLLKPREGFDNQEFDNDQGYSMGDDDDSDESLYS